jgi:DNA repair exonuclease SbcCD ATPase subunit
MLEERLRVLREMYDAYRDLNKTLDETKSKEGVIAKYGDAFNEAFKDFGISVTDYKIDVDILRENGKKSGQIFSDSMVKKIEDAVKNGTYIRSASESLKDVLKSHESSRNQLYDDATGKVIKNIDDFNNKLGTATIGVGHAVTRLSEATKYFGKTLSELEINQIFEADVKSHENALNSVLNKYKNIVLTQEQYDVLLNKTYQGGTKSVEYAIQYATNIDKGLKHFANVKRDLSAIGEDFDKIYGSDFIERYKQASTITERLALALQTTNLYTKKGMQKNMIDGLINRAKELSGLFSGDLSISKVLEESLTPIFSQDFFVNDDKYIEALDKILYLTEDAKERLKIMLEQGRVEWDIILDAKMASDAKIKENVEKMFSDYSSSIELDKMDISPEFAKAFFDIDTTSLEDLKKKLQEIQPKFTGEDMVKQYEEYLKKVEELEVKAQQERLKEYLKYTRNAIGERAKLKLEELQKLSDIEQTFNKAESDKNAQIAKLQKEKPSGYEEEIQQLQEEIKLLQSARQQAKEGIHEETETAIQKLEWEAFKSSETFASMFNDLDNVSSKALGSMIKMLERYRTEWTDLPLSEMKEVINLLDKMDEAQAQKDISANPFKFARDTKREIKKYGGAEKAEEDMLIEQEYQLQLNKEIADLEYIIQLKNEGEELSKSVLDYETKYCVKLKEGQKSAKERLTSVKNEVKESQKREKEAKNIVKLEEDIKDSYQKQAEYMGDSLDMAKDLYDAFSDLYEALGGDKDSPVAIFADMGMSMAETVIQTIMLQLQLMAAKEQAKGLGYAMNTAMGVVGWIVMAIQLIVEGIKAIVANHDNKLQKQIDTWAEGVETLQKEYEKLEKVIEHAISFETYRSSFNEMQENLMEQIDSLNRMIAAEQEKKKTDDDQIKEWKEEMEEAQESLLEIQEQFYEDMGGFGSGENYKSAAEDFIDAWYSAFKETGNGLEGLKEQWDEYFDNIIKKQILMRAGEKYIQPLLKKVDEMLDDQIMDSSEMDYLRKLAEEKSVGLNEILTNFAEALGGFGNAEGSELEGLSKSIQGITETTAQALEAILNSMRLYVIDNNKQLTEIAERVLNFENPQNPILAELKQQTEYIEEIRTFLNSVISRQGSPSIRVTM